MRRVCLQSIDDGLYCYEEMFVWAVDLVAQVPDFVRYIRERFPLLFIDEAQDNSEEQSALLFRLFRAGDDPALRQRFGDSNQAIFDSVFGSDAVTDKFPDAVLLREVPNSHRFGQRIADLAAPLGVNPQPLTGHGPNEQIGSETESDRHTLFLFGKDCEKKVLSAYAELLIEVFSEEELARGSFMVVGQVHRPPLTEDPSKNPRHVGHYWPNYSHDFTGKEPRPATLREHVLLGIAKAKATEELHFGVDTIASGIVRLTLMMNSAKRLLGTKRPHQQIMRSLADNESACRKYQYLVWRFAVRGNAPTKRLWETAWRASFREIVEALTGVKVYSPDALHFLEWDSGGATTQDAIALPRGDNVFKYPEDDPTVSIRMGSVHSVKGETHTSILVLETFWHKHNLESLLPWLNGSKTGGSSAGDRDRARLKLHYVGFTRPSHLLCLAMKQSSFEKDGQLDQKSIAKMQARGWSVKLV